MAVTRLSKRTSEAAQHTNDNSPGNETTAAQQPARKANRPAKRVNKEPQADRIDDQEDVTPAKRPTKKAKRSVERAEEVSQPEHNNGIEKVTKSAKQQAEKAKSSSREPQVQPESQVEPEVEPTFEPEIEGEIEKQKPKKQPKSVKLDASPMTGKADNHLRPNPIFDSRKYDYDNLITVLVGIYAQRFTIHKDKICEKSAFFKAACSTRWLEGRAKVIKLPEVQRVTFQAYIDWVCSEQLPVKSTPATEQSALIKLYLLADVLDDRLLRNRATQRLVSNVNADAGPKFPSLAKMMLIYNATPPGSRSRKMWVDRYVVGFNRDKFAANVEADAYHPEFVREVAVAALRKIDTPKGSLGEWALLYAQYLEPEEEEGGGDGGG